MKEYKKMMFFRKAGMNNVLELRSSAKYDIQIRY